MALQMQRSGRGRGPPETIQSAVVGECFGSLASSYNDEPPTCERRVCRCQDHAVAVSQAAHFADLFILPDDLTI